MQNKSIGIVLKTVERCNIACEYCYFFFSQDKSYLKRSAYISHNTIQNIANFLRQGCIELGLKQITIGFHGGEPLMQKKADFIKMCDCFVHKLADIVEITFTLQTNAMLADEEWSNILYRYNVGVGVSLDGPRNDNDKFRKDKQGRGTYDRVIKGIAALRHRLNQIGLLCVINPEHDPRVLYHHFAHELGVTSMDFLLPHMTHDMKGHAFNPNEYGKFLCELYDAWVEDERPDIKIRYIDGALRSLMGGYSTVYGIGKNRTSENVLPLLSISSDGDLSPVDELRVTCDTVMYHDYNVTNVSLSHFLEQPIFKELKTALKEASDTCKQCALLHACRGGTLVGRFSKKNRFNNPSIYCDGLKDFYVKIINSLVSNDYPIELIENNLNRSE